MVEENKEVRQRRQFFRYEHPAPIRYRFAKKVETAKYNVSPYFKGLGVDFSGNGAAFRATKPLPINTLVFLEMLFPFSHDPMMVTAEVVRRDEEEFRGQKISKIMVKYLVVDEEALNKLISFVISRGKNTS